MIAQRLLNRFLVGALTDQHLFAELLLAVDPAHPDQVLTALPVELRQRFARFVDDYQPGAMLTTYGNLPTADQIEAASRWLAREHHRVGAES
jgi:hypothetical protein